MSTKRSTLFADAVAALIVIAGLFIGSLGIFDAARSADFSAVESTCYDRYQVTHKAVLRCLRHTAGK